MSMIPAAWHLTEEGVWKLDQTDGPVETLRSLCEKHPEWMDLPIGVYTPSGRIDFVGAAGTAYQSEYGGSEETDDYPAGTKILIFSAN